MSMRDNRFLEPEPHERVMAWAVRQVVLWLVCGLAVYLLVINRGLLMPRQEAAKPVSQLAAAEKSAPEVVSNSLILRAAHDGYVYIEASINGSPTRMAFDTGASIVSLTQADAAKAGIAGGLDYSMVFSTANGRAYGAPVTLREIRIGQLAIDDVRAVVMQNLSMSLLGQSFLSRLESYQMRDGVMTLTW
jgi:clan AA aspartic protease (TIGR02281 family)